MGELLNKIEIYYDPPTTINLVQNPELRITDNYYIYHLGYSSESYEILSNFCYFKVLNCFESCKACHQDIKGTAEIHQCLECNTDYKKFIKEGNDNGYYNCYKQNIDEVRGYYLGSDGIYHKCDNSCYSCNKADTCEICQEGYYFKLDKINGQTLNDICYNTRPDIYFLDSYGLNFNGKIINYVYKKCYERCSSCFGQGNEKENKCINCITDYIKYPYDLTKCNIDINDKCQYYWQINEYNNNIECADKCSGFIVHENLYEPDINKPQCVKDCQHIFNPLEMDKPKSLLSYTCDEQKYCITLEYCKLKNLKNSEKECLRPLKCFDMNDYTKVEDTSEGSNDEDIKTNHAQSQIEENIEKIYKRVKLIKFYEFENIDFAYFSDNFIRNLTQKYLIDLNKELEQHKNEYLGGIDFITSTQYKDFILTIYPLQSEDYVYKNLFDLNNLCYVNFTKLFRNINYNVGENSYLMIGLIEHKNINIPLNTINYFFFEYNDKYNNISLVNNIQDSSQLIDVAYPLYNYENDDIDEKYSKNLISTIQKLNSIDSNIVFYDSKDKLYNDICYVISLDNKADITIEDRINEYLVKLSLCENNCTLIKIFNKEEYNNPRSLCQCQLKNDIIISNDNYSFIYERNEIKKVLNINALKCAKEVFASKNISKNYIFWVFILILIILLIIFVKIFYCSKKSLAKQLEKNDKENISLKTNNNLINNFDKIDKNEFNILKYRSVYKENSKNNDISSDYSKKNNKFLTTPHKLSDFMPPKRKAQIILNYN